MFDRSMDISLVCSTILVTTILAFLDLSAAFDTVLILLTTLIKSYLTYSTFSVRLGGFSYSAVPLTCGVSQGSILSPIPFSVLVFR